MADDRLGRVLDKLYLTGLEQIFTSIALEAAKKFSISTETIHLDSSSFHVQGEYESAIPQVTFGQILCNFKQQLNLDSLMVADSALYSASNLALMVNLKWLTRVPHQLLS